jgi:hypothetical protein
MPRATIASASPINVSDTAPGILCDKLQIFQLREADALAAESQTTGHRGAHCVLGDLPRHLISDGEHRAREAVGPTIAFRIRDIR